MTCRGLASTKTTGLIRMARRVECSGLSTLPSSFASDAASTSPAQIDLGGLFDLCENVRMGGIFTNFGVAQKAILKCRKAVNAQEGSLHLQVQQRTAKYLPSPGMGTTCLLQAPSKNRTGYFEIRETETDALASIF